MSHSPGYAADSNKTRIQRLRKRRGRSVKMSGTCTHTAMSAILQGNVKKRHRRPRRPRRPRGLHSPWRRGRDPKSRAAVPQRQGAQSEAPLLQTASLLGARGASSLLVLILDTSLGHSIVSPTPRHLDLPAQPLFLPTITLFLSCPALSIPWTAASQASMSITNSWSLLKLMSTESVMPSNHLVLCHPLLLRLQSFPASGSFPMKNDALCIRWPKCWSFSTSPSTEYSGLISFRVCQEAPCVLFWICQEFSVPY